MRQAARRGLRRRPPARPASPARHAWAILALLLLPLQLPPPAAAATAGEAAPMVEFAVPAQADGAAAVAGAQWLVLVSRDPQDTLLRLQMPGGVQANATSAQLHRPGPVGEAWLPAPVPPSTTPLGAIDAELRPGASWGSVLVLADRIEATVPDAAISLGYASGGAWIASHLPPTEVPEGTLRPDPPASHRLDGDQAALALQPARPGGSLALALRIEGLRLVAWHNAHIACRSDACPDPGAAWTLASAGGTRLEMRAYIEVEGTDGLLEGTAGAVAAALGGPALRLGLAGRLRLPDAHVAGDCGGSPCPDPDGRTLQAAGNVTLDGLAPAPGAHRLRARMAGPFDAAFDERPAGPPAAAFGAQDAAAAGLAVMGLAFAAKLLLGLFSRPLAPKDALAHPRRHALYRAVCRHPGAGYRDLMAATGLSDGVTRHHLRTLQRIGLVVARGHGPSVHYFENHGRYDTTWKPVAALRDPALRALHEWVAAHPGARQRDILAHGCDAWGCSRTALRKRLARLERWGLLHAERQGGQKRYRAA